MEERCVVYSSIKQGETGKLMSVSVPYDPSCFTAEEDIALARQVHDVLQSRMQEWFEEEFLRSLYA